jgi:hypothetical protein
MTLSISSQASASATGAVDAPSYTQVVANEMRVAVGFVQRQDITAAVTALESAGWSCPIVRDTGQGSTGSSGVGATVLVAIKAQGGSASDALNPPAWDTTAVVYWAVHFGVQEA